MAWTYSQFQSSGIGDVIDEMIGSLNGHKATIRAGAKLGASDQQSGAARGVVFVNSNISDVPDAPTGSWARKVFTTGSDYKQQLYQPAQIFLNRLSDATAFWAKTSFTNYKGGKATLEIFYPTS